MKLKLKLKKILLKKAWLKILGKLETVNKKFFYQVRICQFASVCFQIKELRQLKHFLGFELIVMKMKFKRYFKDLLMKFGMLNCKPISTPLEPNARICADEGKDLAYVTMYRQLVGKMIYFYHTRPKISFAVGVMSRYMHNPKKHPIEVKNSSWLDIVTLNMQGVMIPNVQKLTIWSDFVVKQKATNCVGVNNRSKV
uniref:Reverse transcriptase Ty1/copia-type domain-containing protein n=1 Tax=Solanum lycopersicum TaxID=4081 RepID=A0A3Q7GR62_SOLLC